MPSKLTFPLAPGSSIPPRTPTLPRPICLRPRRAASTRASAFDRIYANRLGYSAEVFTVYTDQYYNGFQKYRPFWYDVNAVYAPRLAKRASAFLTAGVGGQSILFYNTFSSCTFQTGCADRVNSNHFMVHLSGGVRYNVWRRFFVRPEANYYRVFNNSDFHSGNVLRLGVSLGYSFPLE